MSKQFISNLTTVCVKGADGTAYQIQSSVYDRSRPGSGNDLGLLDVKTLPNILKLKDYETSPGIYRYVPNPLINNLLGAE